ncbi:hypothetical protein HanRHA438_Chr04g0170621 [Helianthus annuus]|uniref:Uncharacterized protein n=1 Tax=Helianthus annuus TaxID=4232 RepID=A0A251TKE1_HELAN|nr:hypothetical protein HanXRQr2_Chr04g0160421 [Helianthus annuus]KAJ0580681.1 hypothetical protein HanHA300_Chr04g0132091 [Helianthus annuus]KAJ0588322.1 hypothetical protein HanIR_Chr04g0173261 [Helianthus annuus]KAJ0596632.1 hypothetical protein HanHA89_Chr04g0145071 [Helianthus annuus]KAJ0757297.1 hypothetical protein HanLR1_Chr04g0137051 [Helianthus annuus]
MAFRIPIRILVRHHQLLSLNELASRSNELLFDVAAQSPTHYGCYVMLVFMTNVVLVFIQLHQLHCATEEIGGYQIDQLGG